MLFRREYVKVRCVFARWIKIERAVFKERKFWYPLAT
jgi:hypothetical protein